MADEREDNGQLVVVRQKRGERIRRVAILLVFSIVCGAGGFALGTVYYKARYEAVSQGFETVREERDSLRRKATEYREELIRLRRATEMDHHSLQQAQATIRGLEKGLKARKSEISFYKKIMAPGDLEEGLQVSRLDLDPTRNDKRWRYNLVLSQIGDNSRFVSGHVNVHLTGFVGDKRKTLPLEAVSDSRDESDIKFRFRYFQTLDGEMMIPEGFKPDSIQVTAVADRSNQRSRRVFRWQDKTGEEADVSQIQAGP